MQYNSDIFWLVEDALRLMWKRGYRRERELLIWYYPEHMTLDEIGTILGVSGMTASRRRRSAEYLLGLHCSELNQK